MRHLHPDEAALLKEAKNAYHSLASRGLKVTNLKNALAQYDDHYKDLLPKKEPARD